MNRIFDNNWINKQIEILMQRAKARRSDIRNYPLSVGEMFSSPPEFDSCNSYGKLWDDAEIQKMIKRYRDTPLEIRQFEYFNNNKKQNQMATTTGYCATYPDTQNPHPGRMYQTSIIQHDNGYIVHIGCKQFCFEKKNRMLDMLVKYINDPEGMERAYNSGGYEGL